MADRRTDHKSEYYAEQENKIKETLHALKKQLPDYTKDYLTSIELNKKPRTAVAYTRDLITFFKYLKEMNPLYKDLELSRLPIECLSNLSFRNIDEYMTYLSHNAGENVHNNGANAIKRAMSTLRTFFRYEVSHEILVKDPTLGAARGQKVPKKPIDRLSHQEAKQLLQGVESSLSGTQRSRAYTVKTQLRDSAIMVLLLNTGIRISECVGLDLADIDFEQYTIRIERKGGNIEVVYFNDDVAVALKDYINKERPRYVGESNEPALFLSNRKQRMAARSIQEMIEKYGKSVLKRPDLHPHVFRKTFGSNLFNETGDIGLVADILDHSNINVTKAHYAAIDETHKAKNRYINLYKEKDETEDSLV